MILWSYWLRPLCLGRCCRSPATGSLTASHVGEQDLISQLCFLTILPFSLLFYSKPHLAHQCANRHSTPLAWFCITHHGGGSSSAVTPGNFHHPYIQPIAFHHWNSLDPQSQLHHFQNWQMSKLPPPSQQLSFSTTKSPLIDAVLVSMSKISSTCVNII